MAEKQAENPFRIDENDLDGEWRRMATLTRDYGYARADAEYALNRAEAKLKVTAAQLQLAIRRRPGKFNLSDKPVVDEVKAAVETHVDHVRAVEAVDLARYDLSIANANVFAAVDMRRALENSVQLLQINYYAERELPAPTPQARDRVEEARKRSVRRGVDLEDGS